MRILLHGKGFSHFSTINHSVFVILSFEILTNIYLMTSLILIYWPLDVLSYFGGHEIASLSIKTNGGIILLSSIRLFFYYFPEHEITSVLDSLGNLFITKKLACA